MVFTWRGSIYICYKKSGIFNILNVFIVTTYFFINFMTIFSPKLYKVDFIKI